jgi:hypothetical protein
MPFERSRDFRELARSVSEYRSGRADIGPRRPDSARNWGSQINLGGDRKGGDRKGSLGSFGMKLLTDMGSRQRWIGRVTIALIVWATCGACGDDSGPGLSDGVAEDALPGDAGLPTPRVWSPPENISDSPTFSDIRLNWGNSIAIGGSGAVHVTWREVEDPQAIPLLTRIAYRRRQADTWAATEELAAAAPGLGHPKIASAAGQVYVVWHQWDPAPTGLDKLLLAVSDADGAPGSFAPAQTLVDDAPVMVSPAGEFSTGPSIAAAGDQVYVVWSDDRLVPTCGMGVPEIYLLRSPDRAAGWLGPQQVSSADCRSSWTPTVAARGAAVHVAWTDDRHNTDDCALGSASCHEEEYYRGLTDYGATPEPAEVRLTSDDPGPPVQSWAGNIAVTADAVHYAWMDLSGGDGWEVYYARSDDGGLSWTLPGAVLTQHTPGCDAIRPTLAAEGERVHLVWFEMCPDAGGDRATVFHRWSDDGGTTWSNPSDVTSGDALFAIQPSVAMAGDRVHVLWNDRGEIWYAVSPPD